MLAKEAQWFGSRLAELDLAAISPMCNVGSSTGAFRSDTQPWIERAIFGPAQARGLRVDHLDLKSAPGVDIVGDLTEPEFLESLMQRGYRSAFCSNLLEHVTNRDKICAAITQMLPPGGLIFVSCPYRYPYHPDPIDTRFRPDREELRRLFPGAVEMAGERICCGSYFSGFQGKPGALARAIARLCLPVYQPSTWWLKAQYLPWLFRSYQATCLVLRNGADCRSLLEIGGNQDLKRILNHSEPNGRVAAQIAIQHERRGRSGLHQRVLGSEGQ